MGGADDASGDDRCDGEGGRENRIGQNRISTPLLGGYGGKKVEVEELSGSCLHEIAPLTPYAVARCRGSAMTGFRALWGDGQGLSPPPTLSPSGSKPMSEWRKG